MLYSESNETGKIKYYTFLFGNLWRYKHIRTCRGRYKLSSNILWGNICHFKFKLWVFENWVNHFVGVIFVPGTYPYNAKFLKLPYIKISNIYKYIESIFNFKFINIVYTF